MKIIFSLILMLGLVIFGPTGAFAAVHSAGEQYPTDTWYSVDPQTPYWQLYYKTVMSSDTNFTGGELYQNDQTFLRVDSSHVLGIFRTTQLAASYLLDCGIFFSVADSKTNGANKTVFSPGYRFSFDENSYAALSFDYTSEPNVNKVTGYELNLRYYFDNAKLRGDVYLPVTGNSKWDMGVDFAVSQRLVVGCYYDSEYDTIETGFTYAVLPVIMDVKYHNSTVDGFGYYNLSGMVKVGENCGLGLQYKKFTNDSGDPQYTVTFKFSADKADFKIFFIPKNGSVDQSYGVAYYKTL